jgi:hypothetical protein
MTTENICFPLHVMAARSGNATAIHSRTAESIARVLPSIPHKTHVLFTAASGDKGYNSAYNSQFNFWFPYLRHHGLDACLQHIRRAMTPSVADFLHLTKNVRTRLLTYVPVIR